MNLKNALAIGVGDVLVPIATCDAGTGTSDGDVPGSYAVRPCSDLHLELLVCGQGSGESGKQFRDLFQVL